VRLLALPTKFLTSCIVMECRKSIWNLSLRALKSRCPVTILEVQKDWRELLGSANPVNRTWYTWDQKSSFERVLQRISQDGCQPQSREVHVFGRTISAPWTAGSLCKFSFADLFVESLGAADYPTIASTLSTMAITDVLVLLLSKKDQARLSSPSSMPFMNHGAR
jgi:protein AFG1